MNYLKLPRITKYCRKVSLTLSYENNHFTKKARSQLMRSIAGDWGEVQVQSTILCNRNYSLKNYSCSGHGGYLLFSNTKLSDDLPCELNHKSYKGGFLPEFYIYQFEEDCVWSLLSLISTPNTWNKIEMDWKKRGGGKDGTPLIEYANKNNERYFSEKEIITLEKVI